MSKIFRIFYKTARFTFIDVSDPNLLTDEQKRAEDWGRKAIYDMTVKK